MNLADCYRVLGLRTGAPFEEIKGSYRRLARRYHPDVNPGDRKAKEKFIQLTEAYQVLSQLVQTNVTGTAQTKASDAASPARADSPNKTTSPRSDRKAGTTVTRKPPQNRTRPKPKLEVNPALSEVEQRLKQSSYEQLQQLFQAQKFPRAIALVEGLAQRIPKDREVRQWQAITYERWGRSLIRARHYDRAKRYLKKALRTDPQNKALWTEVNRDFQYMEQMWQQSRRS